MNCNQCITTSPISTRFCGNLQLGILQTGGAILADEIVAACLKKPGFNTGLNLVGASDATGIVTVGLYTSPGGSPEYLEFVENGCDYCEGMELTLMTDDGRNVRLDVEIEGQVTDCLYLQFECDCCADCNETASLTLEIADQECPCPETSC